jgi:hypothetical protein
MSAATTTKSRRLPKLTDAERHKRFLDMAQTVGAPDDKDAFDKAFAKVVKPILQSGDLKDSHRKGES